jgi:CheY-like chemotaxis protein
MKKQILLVDDDEIWIEAASRILRIGGYDVLSAPDHREALQILEGPGQVDLLLTDVVMPQRVNGVALARMAGMRRPGLKVIYITGYDLPGLSEEANGTILRKPVEEAVLLREVAGALAS